MNAKEVHAELERLGTEQNRRVYARHGVGPKQYGVSFANLKALAKRIKVDHALALELWRSGHHDARLLTAQIADPAAVDDLYASVIPGLTSLGTAERSALEALLREDHPGATLEAWDRQYYHTVQQRRDFGIDVVEYVNQFFMDKAEDTEYLKEMKKRAADNGVKSLLIMCDSEGNLGDPDSARRST